MKRIGLFKASGGAFEFIPSLEEMCECYSPMNMHGVISINHQARPRHYAESIFKAIAVIAVLAWVETNPSGYSGVARLKAARLQGSGQQVPFAA